jgi:hypothetical protein
MFQMAGSSRSVDIVDIAIRSRRQEQLALKYSPNLRNAFQPDKTRQD